MDKLGHKDNDTTNNFTLPRPKRKKPSISSLNSWKAS